MEKICFVFTKESFYIDKTAVEGMSMKGGSATGKDSAVARGKGTSAEKGGSATGKDSAAGRKDAPGAIDGKAGSGAVKNENEYYVLIDKFVRKPYITFYQLAFSAMPDYLDPAGGYIYRLAEKFVEDLASVPGLEISRDHTELEIDDDSLETLLGSVPFAIGAEFVTKAWVKRQYRRFLSIFKKEIRSYPGKVSLYFAEKNEKLHIPERVFFHLVENPQGELPFAFLATYATRSGSGGTTQSVNGGTTQSGSGETTQSGSGGTTQSVSGGTTRSVNGGTTQSVSGGVRHVPLRYALTEYNGDKAKLLELLSCLNKAAEVSELIGEFMDNGELFHPLALTAEETYRLLKDIPKLEEVGIRCRIPNWWRKRYSNLSVSIKVGDDKPKLLGLDSILSVTPELTLDGAALSKDEIKMLLEQSEGLLLIKGKWIEVDHGRLQKLLEQLENHKETMTFLEALRSEILRPERNEADDEAVVTNGKWLKSFLKELRNPSKLKKMPVPESFNGSLRPYQDNGFNWLMQMNRLKFGACLADDMGLGKTVQILAFLEAVRKERPKSKALLVVPASLLGNWKKEAEKFAPQMSICILYGGSSKKLSDFLLTNNAFLTVTTYRMACSVEGIEKITWDCLILDEAQAIKNPGTIQTKRIKKLKSRMRIALTGTPIENELFNLWSIFDFLNKGLLGSSEEFRDYCKELQERPEGYAKLKNMIAPFMLRRVKTDKKIISDLPDKFEKNDYVELSKKQIVLYKKLLSETETLLVASNGMQRRGLILSLLLHLKQICNHPDQYLGQEEYDPELSGKFEMLEQICRTIYEKRERVLVFTQFKELTGYLDDFLAQIFRCRGGVIHGGISANKRAELVEQFQAEEYMPYMVLSVRAGGTGLNLTKASHVIHFDRWWNPSVENQATDRAFRIGQDKNVMVHKFICQGTIEEKIDKLIESKRELAENVIGSGGENWITEMSNEELLSMLRLEV